MEFQTLDDDEVDVDEEDDAFDISILDEVEYDEGVEEEMEFQTLDEDEVDVDEEDDAFDISILDEVDSGEQLAEPASGNLQSVRKTDLVSAEEPKKKKRKKSEKW